MPQIFVMISPKIKLLVDQAIFQEFDKKITELIVAQWNIPESDIAFSAEFLSHTRGEADIQVEIRYTDGTDKCRRDRLFNLSKRKQIYLSGVIIKVVKGIVKKKTDYFPSVSVWIKPFYKGVFTSA